MLSRVAYTLETPPLELIEVAGRIALAAALGAAVGMEREWRERAAGLRTHVLVSVGSAVFAIISAYGFADFYSELFIPDGVAAPPRDPGRIAAQVVSGIGFLGGGVILRSGLTVRGLTTAATLWATSAIGLAVGAGMYALGSIGTGAVLLSLIGLRRVNQFVYRRYHTESVRISLRVRKRANLEKALDQLKELADRFGDVTVIADEDAARSNTLAMTTDVVLKPGLSSVEVAQRLAQLQYVDHVSIEGAESDA
jgi:putative Mg2+ transporter-C (MgtC) family protein